MKKRRWNALCRGGIASTLALTLAFTVPSSSWAYWSSSASPAKPSVVAATVPIPGGFTCDTSGTLVRTATVSWNAVAGATQYQVWVSGANDENLTLVTTLPSSQRSVAITGTLLGSLVPALLNLLLGGGPIYISVAAVHTSGWTSKLTPTEPVRNDGLGGLLGGKRCG